MAALIRTKRSRKPLLGRQLSVEDLFEDLTDQQAGDSAPYTSLVQLAVNGTDPTALPSLLAKVACITSPATTAETTHTDSGGSSQPTGTTATQAGSYWPTPELHLLLASSLSGIPQPRTDNRGEASARRSSDRPPAIHIYSRTSSAETGMVLSGSVSSQVAACAAAVGQLLCSCSTLPQVVIWTEVCSVYAHRPADRRVLQRMLGQLQPGDAVVVASPDRLARSEAYLCWVVNRLRDKGTALLAVAISQHALLPLVVLDDGGQTPTAAASTNDSSAGSMDELLQQVLPAVCKLLATVCWATSTQHAAISAQHAYMAGQLRLTSQQDCGAVSSVLSVLLATPPVYIYTRVSNQMQQGSVQAMAGGLQRDDLATASLSRQQQYCTRSIG